MLDEFVYIISSLNNGTVIYEKNDVDTEILLGEANLKLYHTNSKHYFLSEYQENYDVIEKSIKSNQVVRELKDIRPNNSYLILFYKINSFDEEVSKKIIRLEENEFFYKKYVFYYTEKEYKSFVEWFNISSQKKLSKILETEECTPKSGQEYIDFLLRLIIKIPFLNLEFKKMELANFDNLLDAQLDGIRKNKDEVHKTYDRLANELKNRSADEIAETLFGEIIGGIDDENQID